MLRVLSEGRKKPGMGWDGIGWALGVVFLLWLVTVVTYWTLR